MKKILGTIPVLVTPLDEKLDIDVQGLSRLLKYLLNQKIGGLWVLGTGSEDMNLTFDKRLKVARSVCEIVGNRVPIVLGAGFFAMEDTLNFFKETKSLNNEYYHVMPYHPLLSERLLEKYYLDLAEASPKPLWLYTSGNWSQQLSSATVARLKAHSNIAGIKFSNTVTTDLANIISLRDETFQVVTAVAKQAATCYMLGSQGHTSSIASVVPHALTEIFDLVSAGDHKLALKKQQEFNSFLAKFPPRVKKDNFLGAAEEKYLLSKLKICSAQTTSYYRELDDEEMAMMDALFEESIYFKKIREELKQ